MGNDIGRFKGPLGSSGYWELPNRGYEWETGISLGPYRTGVSHVITSLGSQIRDFKYWSLPENELLSLADGLTNLVLQALWERFASPPFSFLLAVPPNHHGKPSLPRHICKSISDRYPDRFTDMSSSVVRARELDSVKGVHKGSRARYLKGAWEIDTRKFTRPPKGSGVLIVDDVYDTGATMREMSRTLRRVFSRDVNQYMLAVSHVETRDWNQL